MQVRETMSHPVHVASLTTESREAASLMRDKRIGVLPVVPAGENDRVVGMVTDRDIVVRAVAENRLPSDAAVSTVMSGPRPAGREGGRGAGDRGDIAAFR